MHRAPLPPRGSGNHLIHVAVADNDTLYALVIDRRTQRRRSHVRTSIVYEHIRRDAPVGSPPPR